jgi:hypothetical protein
MTWAAAIAAFGTLVAVYLKYKFRPVDEKSKEDKYKLKKEYNKFRLKAIERQKKRNRF